ncbi:MAG: hypothetical protein M3O50_16315 [Myxococcota bacterium]|nr:hypothetical protein [Myxococcota bacterium]
MLDLPTRHVTSAAKRNLDLFRSTSAARELDEDAVRWKVIEWSWTDSPPLRIHLRSEAGANIHFVMDASGLWQLRRDPMTA